jgi:hypothetical protein
MSKTESQPKPVLNIDVREIIQPLIPAISATTLTKNNSLMGKV